MAVQNISPTEQIQNWRQHITSSTLRVALVLGWLVLAVPLYSNYVNQRYWMIFFFIAIYVLVVIVTLWPKVTFAAQTSVVLILLYILGLNDILFINAQNGDGFYFMMAIPILSTLLFGQRLGWFTLALVTLTLVFSGWLFVAGYLAPPFSNATNINVWITRIAILAMLDISLIFPFGRLFQYFTDALNQSYHLTWDLKQKQVQLEAEIARREQETAERQRLEEQFRQSQKMEAVGRLAGGVAHDFNNLLTVITGYSELLLHRYIDPHDSTYKSIQQIIKAAEQAASLTQQLLVFSRKQVVRPQIINLNSIVTDMENMLRRLIGEDIDLATVTRPDVALVNIDSGQMQQVILNLAVNARDAMPQGGQLTIETANVELDETYARQHIGLEPGAYVMLAIIDTGLGMDKKTQAQIFEPFFTTKERGKGTGLGLATVYGIVKQSEGNIYVYSEPGQGTAFKIYLPRVKQEMALIEKEARHTKLPHGTETILLVEDDAGVRMLAQAVLCECGHTVYEAAQADEALEICRDKGNALDMLITDIVMPGGKNGRELAEEITAICPNIGVLYMSGYTDDAIIRHGVLEADVAFLQKPFSPDALARKVREILDAS